MKVFVVCVLSTVALLAIAQQTRSDSVARYKQDVLLGCKEKAIAQSFAVERADKVCTCLLQTLEQEVSESEWEQLMRLSGQSSLDAVGQLVSRHSEKIRLCGSAGRATSTDAASQGITASQGKPYSPTFGERIAAAIRPRIIWAEKEPLPETHCEVKLSLDAEGNILERRVVRSSDDSAWCATVLRAIDQTGKIPKDVDGRVPAQMAITFGSKD